jgi:hypothetical protein
MFSALIKIQYSLIIAFYPIDYILKLLPVIWVKACNVTFILLLPFFLGVAK